MLKIVRYSRFFIPALLFGLAWHYRQQPDNNIQMIRKDVNVTIFVHGIIGISPHLTNPKTVQKLINGNVYGTKYEKITHKLRNNTFFWKTQCMQQRGLVAIDTNNPISANGSSIIGTLYKTISYLTDNKKQIPHFLYTYGWSGLFSSKAWYDDAHDLFNTIENLYHKLILDGYNPHIRLVGFSHGASVCLKLGEIYEEQEKPSFIIDELVLLGLPIRPPERYCIHSKLFKRIYHIFSPKDRVQCSDLLSPNQFFSHRMFDPAIDGKLPAHLTQAEIKITRLKKNYKDKKLPLNFDDHLFNNTCRKVLRNMSCGHIELWFLGWIPGGAYRDHFTLYPLPLVIFVPYIIDVINNYANDDYNFVRLDIRPEFEIALLKNSSNKQRLPFFCSEFIDDLKEWTLKFKPEDHTKELFNKEIAKGFNV
jgi:hypothetical protein